MSMHCDNCGGVIEEAVSQCRFCGSKLDALVSLKDETKTMLLSLDAKMEAEVSRRTNNRIALAFFVCLTPAPASYFLLQAYAGLTARIVLAVLVALVGFVLFGFRVLSAEDRAEQAAWKASIGPALKRFTDRKRLTPLELAAYGRRELQQGSRLLKFLSPE